ncbi:MAG: Lar family restriction alleviation protein [Desulfobacterales bacterium]|nr:MAG: Lar family restriction alleviation protein [Desulfobacterales bacterium]
MSILNDDVKPCPFCGADEYNPEKVLLNTIEMPNGRFAVACACGANGPTENTQEDARHAWNTRDYYDKFLLWNPFRVSKNLGPVEFKGNLSSVALSAILQLLSSEQKTGILKLVHGQKKSAICLKGGRIIAASGNEGLQLGGIVYDNGLISKQCLQQSLEQAKESGRPLGEVLLSLGHVSHDALMKVIRFQIREVMKDLLFWREGEFQYRDCSVEFDQQWVEEISTIAMLLEATVVKDELDAA